MKIVVAGAGYAVSLMLLGCSTARVNMRETMVIREIQTIHQAETQYLSKFGKYASTLGELGPGGADLIPAKLASGETDGYVLVLRATNTGYSVNANPKVYGDMGRRTFFSDQTMTIRQNWSAVPASAASREVR